MAISGQPGKIRKKPLFFCYKIQAICCGATRLMVNTDMEKIKMIEKLLERLAEMFPKQDYQSRLERYLASKNITTAGEIDHWVRQFDRNNGSWA